LLAVPSAVGTSAAVVKRVVVLFDEANAIREAGPTCTAAGGIGLFWETSSVVGRDTSRRVWGKSAILPVAGCMNEGIEKEKDTREEGTHFETLCAVLIARSATRKNRVKDEKRGINRTLSTVVSGQWKQQCRCECNKEGLKETIANFEFHRKWKRHVPQQKWNTLSARVSAWRPYLRDFVNTVIREARSVRLETLTANLIFLQVKFL
jgi:hypothetical protein